MDAGIPFVDDLRSFGDRPAVAGDATLTYRELADGAARLADVLGPVRRLVAVEAGNTAAALTAYLGALAGGHVAWLLPPDAADRTAPLLERFRPDVTITCDGEVPEVRAHRAGSGHALHPDLALVLGTSGSTGCPRLVRLSRENLASNAEAIATYLGIGPGDRAVTTLPMHYCYGLSVVHSHLLRGAALVLTGRSVTDPALWELMREERATSFAGVPHTFDLLDRTGFADMDLPDLRYVTQAGGRMAPCQVHRYARLGARRGWRLFVMYGQTEATARMAYLPPELAERHPGAVGVAIPGGRLEVRRDPAVDPPGVGELVYSGPNVMLGYAERPEDLALGRAVHELRTGDLGRVGPDGLVEVVGRRSRFLKLFGLRVDLGHLEEVLAGWGVPAVCAGTDRTLAIAVSGPGDPGEIARRVAAHTGLAPSAVRVRCGVEVPRTPSGKPDHAAVARLAERDAPGTDVVDSATVDAGAIAAVFREVLGVPRVGDGDSFAGLGGDSLSFVEMSIALEELLGRLPEGWPEMTVAELAGPAAGRTRAARMETNLVLRAAAVVLVVASHMTAFIPAGGAHLLLAIAGFNFSRFPLAAIGAAGRMGRAAASIARIAVPTSLWIGLQMLLVGGYGLGALLLVNNYTGDPARTGHRWEYWFLEALVQLLAVLAVLFCVPAVRRLHARRPFAFAMGLLAITLVPRFGLIPTGDPYNAIFRPHMVAWVFLLGWAAHRADGVGRRLMVSAVAMVSVPGFFGQPVREAIVLGGLLALLWIPVLPVPRVLARGVGLVAAASMYIYLTHWQVWPMLSPHMPFPVALTLTVATGVGVWVAAERITGGLVAAWRRRPQPMRIAARPAAAAARVQR